jgi:hypothetical protein
MYIMNPTNTPITQHTEFIENVQKWMVQENQLKLLNEKSKQLRDAKTETTKQICEYIRSKNLQTTKIELSDGELKLFDKREYPPLTFSYIRECLEQIISEESQIEYILQYIKEHREVKSTTDIKRVRV